MANLAETKGMRIYVATPINARHEKTFEEKREMAAHRCELLKKMLREEFAGAEIITPFDVNPIDVPIEENEAIGKCETNSRIAREREENRRNKNTNVHERARTSTNVTDNDSDNDNDSDSDNDNESDISISADTDTTHAPTLQEV